MSIATEFLISGPPCSCQGTVPICKNCESLLEAERDERNITHSQPFPYSFAKTEMLWWILMCCRLLPKPFFKVRQKVHDSPSVPVSSKSQTPPESTTSLLGEQRKVRQFWLEFGPWLRNTLKEVHHLKYTLKAKLSKVWKECHIILPCVVERILMRSSEFLCPANTSSFCVGLAPQESRGATNSNCKPKHGPRP